MIYSFCLSAGPGRLWSFEVTGDDVEQHERDESLIQSAGSLSESLISPPLWLYNLTPSFRCRGERIRTGPRSSTSSTRAARTLRSLACPMSPSSWFTLLIRWEGMWGWMAIPCSLALMIPMMSGIWVQRVEHRQCFMAQAMEKAVLHFVTHYCKQENRSRKFINCWMLTGWAQSTHWPNAAQGQPEETDTRL